MFRAAKVILIGAAFVSCDASVPPEHEAINPLTVAETYAREHYPQRTPAGLERAWLVEDHGDVWTVEMFKQGVMGGGIKMVITKRDGRVLGAELTQ